MELNVLKVDVKIVSPQLRLRIILVYQLISLSQGLNVAQIINAYQQPKTKNGNTKCRRMDTNISTDGHPQIVTRSQTYQSMS